MEIKFSIEYSDEVIKKDIPKLSPEWKKKIGEAIETKLATYPEAFGKPLRYSLRGHRCLRIADYRVVFRIQKNIVKILAIKHRENIYKIQREDF